MKCPQVTHCRRFASLVIAGSLLNLAPSAASQTSEDLVEGLETSLVTTAPTGAVPANTSGFASWDRGAQYGAGDQVFHQGKVWEAQQWTQGDEPGGQSWGPWAEDTDVDFDAGSGSGSGGTVNESTWSAASVYTQGDQVTHGGKTWEAQWWTQGDEPGSQSWGPWIEVP